jgi:hypothetical protein
MKGGWRSYINLEIVEFLIYCGNCGYYENDWKWEDGDPCC